MIILNIVTGLFLVGMGFLVKSYPNLISGYNTLSPEKKKNVDIKGLSTYLRNGLVLIGLATIIIPTVFFLDRVDFASKYFDVSNYSTGSISYSYSFPKIR